MLNHAERNYANFPHCRFNAVLRGSQSETIRSALRTAYLTSNEACGGMMRLKQVNGIDIGAGEAVAFEPGGRHIMLIGLTRPLMPGATLELAMRFASGIEVTVADPIRDMRQ